MRYTDTDVPSGTLTVTVDGRLGTTEEIVDGMWEKLP